MEVLSVETQKYEYVDHPVLRKVIDDLNQGFTPKYFANYLRERRLPNNSATRESFISGTGLLYPAKKVLMTSKDFYIKDSYGWYVKLDNVPEEYKEVSWNECAPKTSLSHVEIMKRWVDEFGPIFEGYVSDMEKIVASKTTSRPSLMNAYDYFNSMCPFPISKFKFVSAEYIYLYPVI